MSNPSDFREARREARVKRIAQRIHAAGGVKNLSFPSMDAICAPGTGGWVPPEPSKAAMEHMASYGYVAEAREQPAPEPVAVPDTTLADAIAAGVAKVLASMGIKAP